VPNQRGPEGTFWIAEQLSNATEAEDGCECGGEVVKAGYLVVKARWLACHSTEHSPLRSARAQGRVAVS
jgi:hypothetical protein